MTPDPDSKRVARHTYSGTKSATRRGKRFPAGCPDRGDALGEGFFRRSRRRVAGCQSKDHCKPPGATTGSARLGSARLGSARLGSGRLARYAFVSSYGRRRMRQGICSTWSKNTQTSGMRFTYGEGTIRS
jgi:hypothetical protein